MGWGWYKTLVCCACDWPARCSTPLLQTFQNTASVAKPKEVLQAVAGGVAKPKELFQAVEGGVAKPEEFLQAPMFVLRFRRPKGGTIHGQQIKMVLSQGTKARASPKASPRARTREKEVRPVPVQEKASLFGTLRRSAVSHRRTRCGGKRRVRANRAAKPTFQNSGCEVIQNTMPSMA